MSNMSRKFKRNKNLNIKMSLRLQCPKCGFEKLIPREVFQSMSDKEYKNSSIFICDKCNSKMIPVSVEADF